MSAMDMIRHLTLPFRRGAEFAEVPLGADTGGMTAIGEDAFKDYRARWGEEPATVAYVIVPRRTIGSDDLVVELATTAAGGESVTVVVPRATRAGTGFVVPLPAGADGTLRLKTLRVTPQPPGAGRDAWQVLALLGTTAKLIWLLGAEKDAIARVRDDVRRSRFVATAFGAGLDALGRDMRIPRFPPRPYSVDGDTVALWHLDEGAGVVTAVDQTTRPGHAGHPGTIAGAVGGTSGKYSTGLRFDAAGGTSVTVPAAAALDIPAGADATMEAFVSTPALDSTPRVILARRAAETTGGASHVPGWSLSVVDARGFAANVMFALCDGTTELRLFADLSVADGLFHHVAGFVDRGSQRARLLVDGVQRSSAPLGALGAVAPPDDLRIGSTAWGNNFGGVIDEVRLSRVARLTFHPALGEDDEAYRARLRLFRRWVLPTPANLISMINEAAPLEGEFAPYVLVERNRATQTAQVLVRIVPETLTAGLAIAGDGTAAGDDVTTVGGPDDPGFDPALDLVAYVHQGVDTVADPGHGRMQAGVAALLDALAAVAPGGMTLEQSYNLPGPTALHAVGRALRLRHATLRPEALAAIAHRVGFPYVRNLGPDIAVAVPQGERIAIRTGPVLTRRVDAGQPLDLSLAPALPTAGSFAWTIVTPGPAKARFVAHPADPVLATPADARPRVRLLADAPGDLAVRIEYRLDGRTRSGTLALRIDPASLADGHAIDAAGHPDPDPAPIAGTPEMDFDPAYLVSHVGGAAVDLGVNPDNARMQVVTRDALDALIVELARRGQAGRLQVKQALVPDASGVEGVGRRLVLGHESLDPGLLGALACRFFDYVSRTGPAITVLVRPATLLGIGTGSTGVPVPRLVHLGTPLSLAALPTTLPAGSYNWSTRAIGAGAGTFDVVLKASTTFTPARAGLLALILNYVRDDESRAAPYTFEIRLKPALDVPATIIPKPQYDIIMNLLDTFRPIGVGVSTDGIRPHVREIEQDLAKALPAYSFPNFRV